MSGLDNRFISSLDLEPYFVSNQSGEANAGGIVTFYKDNARTVKKLVYQLTQATPGVYSYVALPDPITLSGVGTFQNAGGDNIAVYYFPFDGVPGNSFGTQELYYITVYDAFGNLQFTREAWPFPNFGTGGASIQTPFIGLTNQLSNPQFAFVNFVPTSLTINIVGAVTTTVPIAPDWSLVIISTGNSSVIVTQMPQAGSSKLPYNPPFTLDFTISANISSVKLIQTLNSNPDWAAPQTTGVMGYLATSILLGAGTSVNVQYAPSSGTATQTLLNKTNTSGGYEQENATVQLLPGANPATGATGYDQIIISILNLPGTASISNVQVIPVTTNVSGVQYDQTPVNRQIDHLFNYYNNLLQYKPIPNLLDAWDFPLNPAQLGSTVAASAIGVNKSKYVWDQTIIFQSANSGVGVSRSVDGSIVLTAAATTQMALIQYQPQIEARKILFNPMSLHIVVDSSAVQTFTASLWYTLDASLPDLNANNSLVLTLGANGKPATFNGNWTQVPALASGGAGLTPTSIGDAIFSTDGSGGFETFKFSGWQLFTADIHAATFFAIVIGTNSVVNPSSVVFNSVNLVNGYVPTIPAPQSYSQVFLDCCHYYQKSFANATVPATGVGTGTGEASWPCGMAGNATDQISPQVYYISPLRVSVAPTLFNPINNNAQCYDLQIGADCSASTSANLNEKGFHISFKGNVATLAGDSISVHWVADARLGIV